VRAWYGLAGWHQYTGRLEESEAAYRRAIASDPGFPDAYSGYAGLLLQRGRPAEALRWALAGIRVGPNVVVPAAELVEAMALVELGRATEAVPILASLESFYREDIAYWQTRARALAAAGDRNGAIEGLARLFDRDGSADTLERLVTLLIEAGRHLEAEERMRREVAHRPSAKGFNLLGVSLALGRKSAEAEAAFRRAVSLDPSSDAYRANLVRAQRAASPEP
jgi:tetratricopeptide (TPR) repeat protein